MLSSVHRIPVMGLRLLGGIAFALAYTQAPLYFSNQNQYFLHGAAWGGHGHLAHDWLAQTTDPTPLFSSGIAILQAGGLLRAQAIIFFIVLALYFLALLQLFEAVSPRPPSTASVIAFSMLIILTHAGSLRWLSAQCLGVDYPWYFQSGLAGQYILGFGLQPSVFGVGLLISLVAFLRDRSRLAAFAAGLAVLVHPTYMLCAGMLALGYVAVLLRERRRREALWCCLLAIAMMAPIVIDTILRFGPTDRATFEAAQRLLARVRIPHHTDPRLWFDWVAGLQLIWIFLGLALLRRTRLGLVLLVLTAGSIALTLLQFAIRSDTLALMFPWRSSAVLIPLATAAILGALVIRLDSWIQKRGRFVTATGAAACVALAGSGVAIYLLGVGYRSSVEELPLLEFVRQNARADHVYLLPVSEPKPNASARGSVSTSFIPPPRTSQQRHIAVDLQRFRLYTGARIYVDFKAVPYKDVEVLEWRRRFDTALRLLSDPGTMSPTDLRAEGITHVVLPLQKPFNQGTMEQIYADDHYRVLRVR